MSRLGEINIIDVVSKLPSIDRLVFDREFSSKIDDMFICCLGFENRCLSIADNLQMIDTYKVREAIYLEYQTNQSDNELNKHQLLAALDKISLSPSRPLPCDGDDFPTKLRELLSQACNENVPNIVFDISTCSSKVLLLTLKILFEFNINLRILYSEAAIYHPTLQEYNEEPTKWTTEEGFGIAKGVGKVILSSEHPGNRRDRLPEAVIVFPTFKPERTKAVITEIDESLITQTDKIIWIVGVPHLEEDHWRTKIMREINQIPESAISFDITTFDYKKTIEVLDKIYQSRDCKYHITISPLGSKLQSLGIALFWYLRQDVSIVFAVPKEFNASQYSEGCKEMWIINFGETNKIKGLLDSFGQLQIIN